MSLAVVPPRRRAVALAAALRLGRRRVAGPAVALRGCGSILAGGGGWASSPTEGGGYWRAPSNSFEPPGPTPGWSNSKPSVSAAKNCREFGLSVRCEPPWVPRQGNALLQGIAICGRCGRRMGLHYSGQNGNYPVYLKDAFPGYIASQDAIIADKLAAPGAHNCVRLSDWEEFMANSLPSCGSTVPPLPAIARRYAKFIPGRRPHPRDRRFAEGDGFELPVPRVLEPSRFIRLLDTGVRVLPKGPTPNRGPKPSPSSGKNRVGSR
jgi:hypothetical protein